MLKGYTMAMFPNLFEVEEPLTKFKFLRNPAEPYIQQLCAIKGSTAEGHRKGTVEKRARNVRNNMQVLYSDGKHVNI